MTKEQTDDLIDALEAIAARKVEAPAVHVAAPNVTVAAPNVEVRGAASPVNNIKVEHPAKWNHEILRDKDGLITRVISTAAS